MDCRTTPVANFRTKLRLRHYDLITSKEKSVLKN